MQVLEKYILSHVLKQGYKKDIFGPCPQLEKHPEKVTEGTYPSRYLTLQ